MNGAGGDSTRIGSRYLGSYELNKVSDGHPVAHFFIESLCPCSRSHPLYQFFHALSLAWYQPQPWPRFGTCEVWHRIGKRSYQVHNGRKLCTCAQSWLCYSNPKLRDRPINRLATLVLSLTLLLSGWSEAQAPESPESPRLATGVSLNFVEPPKKPTPPNYTAIKQASDGRLAAAEAARQAELAVEAQRQAEAVKVAQIAPTQSETIQTGVNLSTGDPKLYIYLHESGNDPTRWNSSGCLGLGQACPASKLLVVCPTMDYACEDQFFTQYMLNRYGSWQAAYEFWIRTDCRPYCGHWW